MRIAMIGTRGVPARYGGFETAVEEVGRRLVKLGHEVVVYCRNPGQTETEHLGMRLVNLPALHHRTTETLSHSALSCAAAVTRQRPDAAFLFNAANAPLLPLLRAARLPTAVHVDGLESRRAKWRGMGARYYTWAEGAAVRWADAVIADAWAIAEHLRVRYGRDSVYIPYGAPIIDPGSDRLAGLGLAPDGFHLVVARFEPENHVLESVQGYRASAATRPLVVVGDSPYSQWYVAAVRDAAGDDPRVRLAGAVFDQHLLDQLYAGCATYVHGHSVGGTNPSLLRAMGAGAPVLGFDVEFNREVTGGHAWFWRTPAELGRLFDELDAPLAAGGRGAAGGTAADGTATGGPAPEGPAAGLVPGLVPGAVAATAERARMHAARAYVWDAVAEDYERLAEQLPLLASIRRGAPRPPVRRG